MTTRSVATVTSDPWRDIVPPSGARTINAFRVDPNIPWNFFWARSVDRKCLLVLEHHHDSRPTTRLPKFKGVDVSLTDSGLGGSMLVVALLDSAQKDIFHRLCLDIVESTSGAESEPEAVAIALSRTWRWHYLLRGGKDGRLSPEEQKGLIGELLVLERHLLPHMHSLDAVRSWFGPLRAPKDFQIGRVCIEAKARRGGATPYVAISSEHQLDDAGTEALFLHVAELDQAASDAKNSFSLTAVADRVRSVTALGDTGAEDAFETLLSAAGFRWEDDYSDSLWVEGPSRIYRVSGEFPRLTASQLAPGVSNVKYSISLVDCEPFLVSTDSLSSALGGHINVE